ncbi:MAG: ATP-binding protein, partial [Candidatus Latescibacteria bacterium]|nr:ATP-binding protein [Candidatus Latescibacterota bacterium]
MTRPSLYFERIDIRRMPGFDLKGFSVTDLSEGVNIVYGPNASGKTSLSKAIAMLLGSSADSLGTVSLAAQLHQHEETIAIDCNFGRITAQKEGIETEYTPFLPAQVEHRYLLALHDLLQAEDGDLAKEILREASGGFDLQCARDDLGFAGRITGTGTNVYKSLKAAQKDHREAAKSEEVLRSREQDLAALEGRLEDATAAQLEIDHLSRALSYHSIMSVLEDCKIRLSAFPDGVAKLLGNEADQLETFRNDQAALERDRISIETRRDEASQVLESSPLPEEGIGQEIIQSLRGALSELQDLDRRIEASESEVRGLSAQKEQALRQLGSTEEVPESAAAFTTNTLVEIGELAREEASLRAEAATQDQLAAWLNTESTSNGDPDRLNQGLKLLTQWLAKHDEQPSVEERPLLPWLIGATALGLAAVLLGWLVDPLWFLLLIAGGALIAYGKNYGKTSERSDPLPLIQRQYEAQDLEHPAAWNPDHVLRLQVALQSQYGAAAIEAEKKNRWDGLATKRDALAERLEHLSEQRSEISARLGMTCPPGFPELLLTTERLTSYFNAESNFCHAKEQLDGLGVQRLSLQNDVTAKLIQYDCDPAGDTTLLAGLVDKLDTLRETHASALQEVSLATEQATDLVKRTSRLTSQVEKIFLGVGLTVGDDLTLSQWLAQRDDYL